MHSISIRTFLESLKRGTRRECHYATIFEASFVEQLQKKASDSEKQDQMLVLVGILAKRRSHCVVLIGILWAGVAPNNFA